MSIGARRSELFAWGRIARIVRLQPITSQYRQTMQSTPNMYLNPRQLTILDRLDCSLAISVLLHRYPPAYSDSSV
jgi:hypothetical protein